MFYSTFKNRFNSEFIAEKRLCHLKVEQPGRMGNERFGEKAPEKPKGSGIPIDTEPKKIEKEKLELEAKKNLTEAEKKIADKYGGAIFEMDKQPGFKEKGYKDQVYVNVPKNPDKFIGPDGKPKKPRIVYYFNGNNGSIGKNAASMMSMVEKMRANGDPVILVMPQDRNGHWKDYDKPEAFKDVIKMAQQITGVPVSPDVSLASHSGGDTGIGKILTKLKSQSGSDPEAKELYGRIRQIALFDSAYGYHKEFADWAADKNHKLSSNYTDHLEGANRKIEKAIHEARRGDMTGIHFEPVKGAHGEAPKVFAEFLKGDFPESKPGVEPAKAAEVKVAMKPEPTTKPEIPTKQVRPSEPVAILPSAKAEKAWKPEKAPSQAKAKSAPSKYEPPSERVKPVYVSQTKSKVEALPYRSPSRPGELAIKPEKRVERHPEGLDQPPTIKYTTLGDSITVGTTGTARGSLLKLGYHTRPSKENPNNPEMVGKQTSYMKARLNEEVIPSIEKTGLKAIVFGGGGNDILGPLPDDKAVNETEKRVTGNLTEMYQTAHNNGLKVVAMTMPPFDRFIENRFKDPKERERHHQLWERVNQFIINQEGKQNGPDRVVKAHELVGTQSSEDKRWLVRSEMSAGDGVHLKGTGYTLIQREIEKALNGIAAEMDEKEKKTIDQV